MFLHIGNSKIVFSNDLIGIFNVDTANKKANSNFIESASSEAIKKWSGLEQPKSFVVTSHNVFISPISPLTLSKRTNSSG